MTEALRSPNRDRLLRTARLLRPLLGKLVFVGGQVTELLVTDPAAVRVRPTDDVDVVVPVTSRIAYHALQMRLMALGDVLSFVMTEARSPAPLTCGNSVSLR